jgi:hypothetical protein
MIGSARPAATSSRAWGAVLPGRLSAALAAWAVRPDSPARVALPSSRSVRGDRPVRVFRGRRPQPDRTADPFERSRLLPRHAAAAPMPARPAGAARPAGSPSSVPGTTGCDSRPPSGAADVTSVPGTSGCDSRPPSGAADVTATRGGGRWPVGVGLGVRMVDGPSRVCRARVRVACMSSVVLLNLLARRHVDFGRMSSSFCCG